MTERDRDPPGKPDSVLSTIDRSDFDELWLFAVDTGNGLTEEDCAAISRFRKNGGGLLVTRDHMDLGSSVCTLGGVGKAHYFHSKQPDPDVSRRKRDDPYTTEIDWPNFHSGANGDFQEIEIIGKAHPVLAKERSATGSIRFLPSHPHEGDIGAPKGEGARVIVKGKSKATGIDFNITVASSPVTMAAQRLRKALSTTSPTITGTPEPAAQALSAKSRVTACCAYQKRWRTRTVTR